MTKTKLYVSMVFVLHYSIDGYLGYFYNLAIVNIVARKYRCANISVVCCLLHPLGEHLGVLDLGQVVDLFLSNIHRNFHLTDLVCIHIRGPFFSAYLSAFVIYFLNDCHSFFSF